MTPRWFEAAQGVELASILYEPVTVAQWHRGGREMADILDAGSSDMFIPVGADREEGVENMAGECLTLCYPRSVTLDLMYYQFDAYKKRIVRANLVLDNFDREFDINGYELNLHLRPLGYLDLVIQFAFTTETFVILFIAIGGLTCGVAFLFWLVNRLTTHLEHPPKFRFWGFWAIIVPPPCAGVSMGCLPIFFIICMFWLLIEGKAVVEGKDYDGPFTFESMVPHYKQKRVFPSQVEGTRYGRQGFAFFVLASYLIFTGSKVFLPKRGDASSLLQNLLKACLSFYRN